MGVQYVFFIIILSQNFGHQFMFIIFSLYFAFTIFSPFFLCLRSRLCAQFLFINYVYKKQFTNYVHTHIFFHNFYLHNLFFMIHEVCEKNLCAQVMCMLCIHQLCEKKLCAPFYVHKLYSLRLNYRSFDFFDTKFDHSCYSKNLCKHSQL